MFDSELAVIEGNRAKTCFVDSFDFGLTKTYSESGEPLPEIDIPLREFIEYVPQHKMVMYHGSHTTPSCDNQVTWIVNTHPHVITPAQIESLKSLLSA